jgi:hypothetical protein
MEDAVEAFEAILMHIHGGDIDHPCVHEYCLGHDVFAFESVEFVTCLSPDCRKQQVRPKTSEFLVRLNATELCEAVRNNPAQCTDIAAAIANVGRRQKCSFCGYAALRERELVRPARVFALQLVWPGTDRGSDADRELVTRLLFRRPRLGFHRAFKHGDLDRDFFTLDYSLVGLVCYYGAHFIFFAAAQQQQWTLFDDATTSVLGSVSKVEDICIKGVWRPVLALFTETAY